VRLGETEVRERFDLGVDLVGQFPVIPLRVIPAYNLAFNDEIFSMPRLDPIARRSRSASSPSISPTAIAICISCSWNSGTPMVRSSTGRSFGCR